MDDLYTTSLQAVVNAKLAADAHENVVSAIGMLPSPLSDQTVDCTEETSDSNWSHISNRVQLYLFCYFGRKLPGLRLDSIFVGPLDQSGIIEVAVQGECCRFTLDGFLHIRKVLCGRGGSQDDLNRAAKVIVNSVIVTLDEDGVERQNGRLVPNLWIVAKPR